MGRDSQIDQHFMTLALEEARWGLEQGNFPVGAVLVSQNECLAKAHNHLFNHQNFASHAEALLLVENSAMIRDMSRGSEAPLVLYTTLEPCLMCLGTAVLHHISKIVYACPDPFGGAANVAPHLIRDWYARVWPIIEMGPLGEASYQLLTEYMQGQAQEAWQDVLAAFEEMYETW